MKVVVCVKQIAVPSSDVAVGECLAIDPDDLERSLNEWDACAVEEALRSRDTAEVGEVVAVSLGDQHSDEGLRRCLAMGVDRAVRIAPAGCEDADPLAVACALAAVVQQEVPDLVLCGGQSGDLAQAATGTALAELLGLPVVPFVRQLEYDAAARRASIQRELEGGLLEVCEVETPAVLTIQTGINQPRYATLRAIKLAEGKVIELSEAIRGAPPSACFRTLIAAPRKAQAEMLEGDARAVAERIRQIVEGALL